MVASGLGQEIALGQPMDKRIPGTLRAGQKHRRHQSRFRDRVPEQDEQKAHSDARKQPADAVQSRQCDHDSIRTMAAGPNRRFCDHNIAWLSAQPMIPSQNSKANISSGCSVCCASIIL